MKIAGQLIRAMNPQGVKYSLKVTESDTGPGIELHHGGGVLINGNASFLVAGQPAIESRLKFSPLGHKDQRADRQDKNDQNTADVMMARIFMHQGKYEEQTDSEESQGSSGTVQDNRNEKDNRHDHPEDTRGSLLGYFRDCQGERTNTTHDKNIAGLISIWKLPDSLQKSWQALIHHQTMKDGRESHKSKGKD